MAIEDIVTHDQVRLLGVKRLFQPFDRIGVTCTGDLVCITTFTTPDRKVEIRDCLSSDLQVCICRSIDVLCMILSVPSGWKRGASALAGTGTISSHVSADQINKVD